MNAPALPLFRRLLLLWVLLAGFLLAIAPTVSASGIHQWEPYSINYDTQSQTSIVYDGGYESIRAYDEAPMPNGGDKKTAPEAKRALFGRIVELVDKP
jgi:hypothetical protein